MHTRLWVWVAVWIAAGVASAGAGENLLVNAGFEKPLEPAWEKRTPEDAQRRLYRAEGAGRSGAAAVLENVVPAYTRLRQGNDRSIAVAPGNLIELGAWVKSELDTNGVSMLQIYCLGAKGEILSQPTSAPACGAFGWTRNRVRTLVPEGTAYVMAYLQIRDGTGKVWFDDVELTVKRPPLPRVPVPKIALLTDLSDTNAVIGRARVLFEDGLTRVDPARPDEMRAASGALVLYEGGVPASVWPLLDAFARGGGRVFMDIRAFARSQGAEAVAVAVGDPRSPSLEARMAAGLRVVRASDATAGFESGQTMPRAGWPDGKLFVLPSGFAPSGLEVLAVAPGGQAGLVRLAAGKGAVTACDLLSLREPNCRSVDAYYAFTPVSGALGNPVRFGQYYPRRLTYDGVVAEMKRLAEAYPAIRIEEEGPASENYRLWSLNLGKPGTPLYFLYAAAHGSEWESGYGLMTFARLLAEGKFKDEVDLQKVQIKIIPLLNPSGYDRMRRQNGRGVDLNRQGDCQWERFKGRDSNKDGQFGPYDYDWKGTAPFSEPEAQVYRKIAACPELYCVLDLHGNSGAKDNKVGILPITAHPDNEMRALDLQQIANARLRGRHLLRQSDENAASQYLLDIIVSDGARPVLQNTSARDKFGLLIELSAGYANSYGTVLQTDVVCELCRALFLAYPPPDKWPQ